MDIAKLLAEAARMGGNVFIIHCGPMGGMDDYGEDGMEDEGENKPPEAPEPAAKPAPKRPGPGFRTER